jgi:hypothetical protein
MRPTIIQLVDSVQYVETNCFQHQLLSALRRKAEVVQVPADQLPRFRVPEGTHHVLSCLKMRTLHRLKDQLRAALGNCQLVHYEQDPWHGYMDDSPWQGIFADIKQRLNLSFVAVTTRWWADYMEADGIPARFVKMWMMPEYCDRGPAYLERPIDLGFVGSLHPYRRKLFDLIEDSGYSINTSGGYDYSGYLKALHGIKVYLHSEDCPIKVNGVFHNLNDGLWAREIEVAARGCISIRNWGSESDSYLGSDIRTAFLYRDPQDVPGIIRSIEQMDPTERQKRIDDTLEYIRSADEWGRTAEVLIRG